MRVTAAVLDGSGSVPVLREVDLDGPRPDEVLVRLVSVGICGTDLHFATEVPAPAVLGHEGAGVVEQVGDQVTNVAPGDKVLLHFAWCGTCDHCVTGSPSYCRTFDPLNFGGRRADGSAVISVDGTPAYSSFLGQSSFATHAVVSARSVVRLPGDLDLAPIGPLGCGLMTGAGADLNVLRPIAGDTVGVFGAGPVGLAAVMAARAAGARVIAVDVNDARLSTARELGAVDTVNSSDGDVAEMLRDLAPAGLDAAVDATGRAEVVAVAASALHTRGTLAVCGVGPSPAVEIEWRTLLNGRTVTGVISGSAVPATFVPRLIALYRSGAFPMDALATYYDFADVGSALAAARSGEVVKAVLTF
ncbi:MAG: NAD(P)-dependent alcohol dehydrogenase [Candidatus Nanopelagicales bacterium]|nr:NAD(P)-dependent alcohol dehydrogenase [Candidatus Nanopelagicales bacterium]